MKDDLFPPTMMRIQDEWTLYAFREVTMSSDGGRGGQSQPNKHIWFRKIFISDILG